MPKPFPAEFYRDVIAVARKGEASVAQIARDFGISETCLQRWLKIADREDGADGLLKVAEEQPGDFIVAAVLQVIGVLLLIPVLLYLYRATRYRRTQLTPTAAYLAVVFTQLAFLGHDAGHRQIFRSRRANDRVGLVHANLLTGVSFDFGS